MTLIGDDEVEGFDGDGGVVLDGVGRFAELGEGGGGGFLVAGVVVGFAFEDGIEALDGGDGDAADGIDGVGGEQLDVVDFGELAAVAGDGELLEFVEGLAAESAAVDQEENAAGTGVGDETPGEIAGGEGLSAAHGHVDEGARVIASERLFQVGDDAVLVAPKALAGQGGHDAQAAAQGGAGRFEVGFEPGGEGFGAVEGEDGAAAGVGFEEVGEARLDSGGLVAEGERATRSGEIVRESLAVFGGLNFDCDEGNALLLGLDYSGGVAVDVEEVVGKAVSGGEWEFADSDAAAGFDVDVVAILDEPTGGGEQAVDVSAGAVLGPASGWDGHGQLAVYHTG